MSVDTKDIRAFWSRVLPGDTLRCVQNSFRPEYAGTRFKVAEKRVDVLIGHSLDFEGGADEEELYLPDPSDVVALSHNAITYRIAGRGMNTVTWEMVPTPSDEAIRIHRAEAIVPLLAVRMTERTGREVRVETCWDHRPDHEWFLAACLHVTEGYGVETLDNTPAIAKHHGGKCHLHLSVRRTPFMYSTAADRDAFIAAAATLIHDLTL